MKHRYARVFEGLVTHLAQVQPEWIELNPWTNIPGEWVPAPNGVNTEWQYNAATQTFLPPGE
jgi:hypothetical protein